jgi:hypothetical protein
MTAGEGESDDIKSPSSFAAILDTRLYTDARKRPKSRCTVEERLIN